MRVLYFLFFLLLQIVKSQPSVSYEVKYVLCKPPDSEICFIWKHPESLENDNIEIIPDHWRQRRCDISGLVKNYRHGNNFEILTFTSNRWLKRNIFCNLVWKVKWYSEESVEKNMDFQSLRMRREASPRGKYRGQTQSQYLSIDKGKDEGKAEAHSAADTSRALVSGSSGMGQAQSQSIYDPSCDDCYLGREPLNLKEPSVPRSATGVDSKWPVPDNSRGYHGPIGSDMVSGGYPPSNKAGGLVPPGEQWAKGPGRPYGNGISETNPTDSGQNYYGGPNQGRNVGQSPLSRGPFSQGPSVSTDFALPRGMPNNNIGGGGQGPFEGAAGRIPHGGGPGQTYLVGTSQGPQGGLGQGPQGGLGQGPQGGLGQGPQGGIGQRPVGGIGSQGPNSGIGQGPLGPGGLGPMGPGGLGPVGQGPMGGIGQSPLGGVGQGPLGGAEQIPVGGVTGQGPIGNSQTLVKGGLNRGPGVNGENGINGGRGLSLGGVMPQGPVSGLGSLGVPQEPLGGTGQRGVGPVGQGPGQYPMSFLTTGPDGQSYVCCSAVPYNVKDGQGAVRPWMQEQPNGQFTNGGQAPTWNGNQGYNGPRGQDGTGSNYGPRGQSPYGNQFGPGGQYAPGLHGFYDSGPQSQFGPGSQGVTPGSQSQYIPKGGDIYGTGGQYDPNSRPQNQYVPAGHTQLQPGQSQYHPNGQNFFRPGDQSQYGPSGQVDQGLGGASQYGPSGQYSPEGPGFGGVGNQGPGVGGPGGQAQRPAGQGGQGEYGPSQNGLGHNIAGDKLNQFGYGGQDQYGGGNQGSGGPGGQGPYGGGIQGTGGSGGQGPYGGGSQGTGGPSGQGLYGGGSQGTGGVGGQGPYGGGSQGTGGIGGQGPYGGGSQGTGGLGVQGPYEGGIQGAGGQGPYGGGSQGTGGPGGQGPYGEGSQGTGGIGGQGPYGGGSQGTGGLGAQGPYGGGSQGTGGLGGQSPYGGGNQGTGGSSGQGPYGGGSQGTDGLGGQSPYGGGSQGTGGPSGQGPYGGGSQGISGPGADGTQGSGPSRSGDQGQHSPGGLGHYGPSGHGQYGSNGHGPGGSGGQGQYGGQNLGGGNGQNQYWPGGYNQYGTGGQGGPVNRAGLNGYGQNVDVGGVPQNVIDPNTVSDIDEESEALASVNQDSNGTVASASAKGGHEKGRAQTQVQGTYTGSGSFSAQAQIDDGTKGAESQVNGGKQGASSSAQGKGRDNKSQANVQLGSETGSIVTNSQSDGSMHSSNSQVQGSLKGGMADAQARGPGSTSSQAQIGFTPYKNGDKAHEGFKTPFVGGGTASAQSNKRTGQSQSQLQGTFKYGITYNGAAQAGGSIDKDTAFPNRLPFNKIDVFDESNKNIDVNVNESTEKTFVPLTESDVQENEVEETDQKTEIKDEDHSHADHHVSVTESPVSSRRSFQHAHDNKNYYEYTTVKDDNPIDEYDPEQGFDPEGSDVDQPEPDYTNYDDVNRDSVSTHESIQNEHKKGLEVKQSTGGSTQHIVLGSLQDRDAEITQKSTEQRPDESRIYQPGERVPGTGGYTIPIGFTGSVKSVSSKGKTYVQGSKESPSQAQTVSLSPGTGKVKYSYSKPGVKSVNPKDLRSLISTKADDNNKYVTVSKSVTGAIDSENNIKKQYSHTYYTKSSSCGYFTFTCTIVSGTNGRKKVCRPKIPTNPDGTPMNC